MSAHVDTLATGALTPLVRAFLARAALWNLALFGVVRLAWFDRLVITPLIEFQKTLVFWYGATPHSGIIVNSSCSGADVMALCAGVLLAYPMPWPRRAAGAAIGIGLMLSLNAVRIASLYAVAASPARLELLHIYIWPLLLSVAAVAYVLGWIRTSHRGAGGSRWTRFGCAAAGALAVYAAAVPWMFTSDALLEVGAWTASASAAVLAGLGSTAQASGSVLILPRGAFEVTQECLFTPALPLYLAGVLALPLSRRSRLAWVALALPLFFALGVARVLVLALPFQAPASPAFLAHGFYQLIAGAAIIIGAAHFASRGASGRTASIRTLVSVGGAFLAGIAAALVWNPALVAAAGALQTVVPHTIAPLTRAGDSQGALAMFPAFQAGLVAGLWLALTGGRRGRQLAAALACLAGLQLAFLATAGEASARLDLQLHPLVVRAWALAIPVAIAALWARPFPLAPLAGPSYRRFWQGVGEEFPSLTGAASTAYYFENEKRLIEEAVPSLTGRTLLKTDLWDEAKNTCILQWAADRGAMVYGIDLSEPIVRQARDAFGARRLRPAVSDVRRLPFGDGSFDVIYSMGTIEHFPETEAAAAELARLLKPGGLLILGVPNRHDPFLRPLLVAILDRLGLYAYGYERSYSRRALRRMLEDAGLAVTTESGILFMPGWLRMLDLWCYTRARPLARITAALVQPFVWLDRRLPALRRHGYLLASVGVKPAADPRRRQPQHGPRVHSLEGGWRMAGVEPVAPEAMQAGTEYVVDARGCDPEALRSPARLQRLFDEVHADLGLRAVAPPVWHVFPGHGGVTGMVLLSESHLTIHTYPETCRAAINLYCCRPSAEWPWESQLQALLGATGVNVRVLRRG